MNDICYSALLFDEASSRQLALLARAIDVEINRHFPRGHGLSSRPNCADNMHETISGRFNGAFEEGDLDYLRAFRQALNSEEGLSLHHPRNDDNIPQAKYFLYYATSSETLGLAIHMDHPEVSRLREGLHAPSFVVPHITLCQIQPEALGISRKELRELKARGCEDHDNPFYYVQPKLDQLLSQIQSILPSIEAYVEDVRVRDVIAEPFVPNMPLVILDGECVTYCPIGQRKNHLEGPDTVLPDLLAYQDGKEGSIGLPPLPIA